MTNKEAIEFLYAEKHRISGEDWENCYKRLEAIDMAIEALSSEAVEVVRCKDCRYGHKTTPTDSGADILCDYCDWEYFDDDFCSRGECERW